MKKEDIFKLYNKIVSSIEGDLSDRERAELLQTVRSDSDAAYYYLRFMEIYSMMSSHDGSRIIENLIETGEDLSFAEELNIDENAVNRILEEQKTARPINKNKHENENHSSLKSKRAESAVANENKQKRNISKINLCAAIAGAAAMLFLFIYANFIYKPQVAFVQDSLGAYSSKGHLNPDEGLKAGNYSLSEGALKIKFEKGTEAILEAPAMFTLADSNKIILEYGRLNANVPPDGKGFIVKTKNAVIKDLSTQFGVNVGHLAGCQVYVHKGRVELESNKGQRERQHAERFSEILGQYQAVEFDDNESINEIVYPETGYIRYFSSEDNFVWRGEDFSLSAAVSDKNGFEYKSGNKAVDLVDGEIKHLEDCHNGWRLAQDTFKEVESKFIDSVFVPYKDKNGCKISTSGVAFKSFSNSQSAFWAPVSSQSIVWNTSDNQLGVGFAEVETGYDDPVIFMHSNSGITFDLQALRNQYPSLQPSFFQTIYQTAINRSGTGAFRYWVLVDGEVVSDGFQPGTNDFLNRKISVPLDENSRFLTLAITDKDDGTSYDWGVFVNPVIKFGLKPLTQ
ncbi:FecR domain-containing protein [Sedimentisphaera salicampi]|uniref:FecR domain-containing protein n=1 Tax=Sedimentisphaera salicampi TaxID=1941349 RepID=UPI000B9D3FAD|nr:FecR domain-containing protein [Sedimentisphaera salicampi]OXU15547.1 FecR protein [Sedimentisphaera salicampi]